MLKLGLIINPFAGIGGPLGLKGSDTPAIRQQALAAGATPMSNSKAARALEELRPYADKLCLYTAAGEMGARLLQQLGFAHTTVYALDAAQTEATDTREAARAMLAAGVDLLLFAGGDGTARDIYAEVGQRIPVLGIPAGVKIHSGVFGVSPRASGRVVAEMIRGELVELTDAEVRDIDEDAFRRGQVVARYYGQMRIPQQMNFIQAVKSGGLAQEELALDDIAEHLCEELAEQTVIMGSGSTVNHIMAKMQCANTLLGVDVIHNTTLVCQDANARQLLAYANKGPIKLVITPIGGQGHIFGRGNQQLSPAVIRAVGRENIIIVATQTKLASLRGRPLLVDTSDEELDRTLAGFLPVTTGYQQQLLYPVAAPALED